MRIPLAAGLIGLFLVVPLSEPGLIAEVVCLSVTFGKWASASADVMLFSGGRRVFGPDGKEIVSLVYRPDGWVSQGWTSGECSEWEGHRTDARWQPAQPSAIVPPGTLHRPEEGDISDAAPMPGCN